MRGEDDKQVMNNWVTKISMIPQVRNNYLLVWGKKESKVYRCLREIVLSIRDWIKLNNLEKESYKMAM